MSVGTRQDVLPVMHHLKIEAPMEVQLPPERGRLLQRPHIRPQGVLAPASGAPPAIRQPEVSPFCYCTALLLRLVPT